MKLKDALDSYYYNTQKVSEATRSLAFAGIGIVWVFRVPAGKGFAVEDALYLPAALFALALAFDFLQYIAGTVVWGVYHRYKETRGEIDEETEFLAPTQLNWITTLFFWLKVGAIAPGYYVLIKYLVVSWST